MYTEWAKKPDCFKSL